MAIERQILANAHRAMEQRDPAQVQRAMDLLQQLDAAKQAGFVDYTDAKPIPSLHEVPDGERVGTIAKQLREVTGEAIRPVAKRAGMSPMQLSRIESLESQPTESKIRGLARAFGVRIGLLFGEKETTS